MLTKSLLGLTLAACFTLPTWAETTQWGRWSTIRFPAQVGEMLPTGFYARTPSGSDLYIRQDQRVLRDGQVVNPAFLRPGDNVQVVVPAGQGQIRFRDDDVAVLSTSQGVAQVPEENLQLAYQDYTTTALQPAQASNSNYYLDTPRSADSYSSVNFYAPTPSYSTQTYSPTPYYASSYQPYSSNYNNPNGSFSWEGAALSLLGTVLATTLSPNNYNANPYMGSGQGYDPYYSGYNQGYSTSTNSNYNYASNAYAPNWTYGVTTFRPQVQISSWNANMRYPQVRTTKWNGKHYRVNKNPQVQINSYQPKFHQPQNSNHSPRPQVNYGRVKYRPQKNSHGGGKFRAAKHQQNFNPGGGHGGGHKGGGHHGKGHH